MMQVQFNLTNIDWVAISAIATFCMALVTVLSLLNSRKQLRLLKEANRPILTFAFEVYRRAWCLTIENCGNQPASNICIQLSKNFTNKIGFDKARQLFSRLNEPFYLEKNTKRYFYITPTYSENTGDHKSGAQQADSPTIKQWIDDIKNEVLTINGTYSNKYKINESISIDTFMLPFLKIEDEIALSIDKLTTELKQLRNK